MTSQSLIQHAAFDHPGLQRDFREIFNGSLRSLRCPLCPHGRKWAEPKGLVVDNGWIRQKTQSLQNGLWSFYTCLINKTQN